MARPMLRDIPKERFGIWVVEERAWMRDYLIVKGYRDMEPDTGMVYFIQAGAKGPIKIGYTTQIKQRLAALQSTNPEKLRVLSMVAGNRDLEQRLHNVFKKGRIHGEWFRPNTVGLKELVEWAEMRLPV